MNAAAQCPGTHAYRTQMPMYAYNHGRHSHQSSPAMRTPGCDRYWPIGRPPGPAGGGGAATACCAACCSEGAWAAYAVSDTATATSSCCCCSASRACAATSASAAACCSAAAAACATASAAPAGTGPLPCCCCARGTASAARWGRARPRRWPAAGRHCTARIVCAACMAVVFGGGKCARLLCAGREAGEQDERLG